MAKFRFDDSEQEMMQQLKTDTLGQWIETTWVDTRPETQWETLWISQTCVDIRVIAEFNADHELPAGYRFIGREAIPCPVAVRITAYSYTNELSYQTGAGIYRFEKGDEIVEVLVVASFFTDEDHGDVVCLACVPEAFIPVWTGFIRECNRLSGSLSPTAEVIIIGGRANSFSPTVDWDEIVLPEHLKDDIMDDIQSFFAKGIDVYKRLNLKPFRKLLLAGVPGTGKTMLCSALAKWALAREYVVIYISSADQYESTFSKIQHALDVASRSAYPALIILEELDAYLHEREKAMVLNVLDGSESAINDQGTLLIATTNYPEAIDERVLKRPGRLDRIFIVPETRQEADAEKMLRQYLGAMWRDEHAALVPSLIGFPGAFIREVAVYALTQVAYEDLDSLSLELLEASFNGLKEQIEAKDDFLTRHAGNRKGLGYMNGH